MKILKIPFEKGNPTGTKGPAQAPDLICKGLESSGNKILAVGGDHSITYELVKKAKPEALLYFDAHLDCEDNFIPPSHEDVIQAIVNQKIVKPENIFIIGARKFYPKELEFVRKHKIKCVKHIDSKLYDAISSFKTIYISIDIDVFDPSEAPGTNYPVEMGVKSSEFFEFLEKLDLKKVVGADIVEVNPAKDAENKTISLARKIVERFL